MCSTECACCGEKTTDFVILVAEAHSQATHHFIPLQEDNSTFRSCKFSPEGVAAICVDCATTLLSKEKTKRTNNENLCALGTSYGLPDTKG